MAGEKLTVEHVVPVQDGHRLVRMKGRWHNAYRLEDGTWMACPEPLEVEAARLALRAALRSPETE